jgi:hypothetical protein
MKNLASRRTSFHFPALAIATFYIVLAAAQALLFAPEVAAGRALEAGLYRVDGLGLVFGVAWCLGAAAAAWVMARQGITRGIALPLGLMSVGVLSMAYAREPLLLYAAWEVAGVGVWLAARMISGRRLGEMLLTLHAPGWPLLLAIVLGIVAPLAPPFAGEGQPWQLWVAIIFGVTALMRAGVWPFGGWTRQVRSAAGSSNHPLIALYAMAAPFVLAKALVAAPWEPLGAWALTLIGMLALVASVGVLITARERYAPEYAPVFASAAVISFGLAPLSPLAAMGGLAVVLAGLLVLPTNRGGAWERAALLMALFQGVWFVAQGALAQGYDVIAILLLPILAIALLFVGRSPQPTASSVFPEGNHAHYGLQLIAALLYIYPQALVWLALQPGVSAMAGGVDALNRLSVDWGVGLRVEGAGGVLLAALPATGVVVVIFLAWAALYWLRRLVVRFYPESSRHSMPEQEAG